MVDYLSDKINASNYFSQRDTSEQDSSFGKDDGCSKMSIGISKLMEQEIGIHRPASAIKSKTNCLVGQFKVALDESKNIGHGIKLEQDETSFCELMIGRFKWFFVLEPVLIDRPSIQPYITTDDIDGGEICSLKRTRR